MNSVNLRDVKKGELVRFKASDSAPVWIRGDFVRGDKTYSLTKVDDSNHETFRKGSTKVYVGFTY